MPTPPLAGVRVLELAQGVAGPYAAKLLADLGALITKLEPPAGDTARRLGPFAQTAEPSDERSGLFAYLNAGKRGIVLDLETRAGRAACAALADTVDLLIDSYPPGELERHALGDPEPRLRWPSLVRVSVTPFGQSGPRASWHGNDLIAFHSSGFAYAFPSLQVDAPDLPPLNGPTYAAEFLAGQVAAAAALHGLLVAQRTGHGSHLDVSLQEAVGAANYAQFNQVGPAATTPRRRVFSDRPSNAVVALLPCADGWVAISPREEHQWARWLEVMGGPAWAADPRFADRAARERNWTVLYPLLAGWSRARSKTELFEAAQARRVACFPLGTATDLLGSAQLAARAFFVEVEDLALGGRVAMPGRPYHLAVGLEPVPPPPATRAPRLGEHTHAVLAELDTARTASPEPAAPPGGGLESPRLRPLAGVRVVDFSWVLTGPICTRSLAALGAEVIKVETAARPDLSQRNLTWEELNPGKRSITLNLTHERARDLARALVARSDVVVENFSTGVMERLGLDYPRLRRLNPRLVMASSSALGRTGPDRDLVAYGTLVQCFTGWTALSAHPGHPPRSAGGVWTDPLAASLETLLVLAAIWRQRASGVGAFVDLSMAEATIAALPEPILAWSLGHQVVRARGNRHPVFAPQGCYPALGEDRWVALSVRSDAEWAAVAGLMGRRDLLADTRLATAAGRRALHDALDAAIAGWTIQRPAETTAACLQARGIAATPTLEPAEVLADPHLAERRFISRVERLDGSGTLSAPGVPWLIDGQRPNASRRPPRLGEDNRAILQGLLGLADDEYAVLVRDQVIY